MLNAEQDSGYMAIRELPVAHETTDAERIPFSEKYALTIKEAAIYFNIGSKKLRRLAEENLGRFAVESGNRFLIIRPKFEHFLDQSSSI